MPKRVALIAGSLAGVLAAPASADVTTATAHGFEVRHRVQLVAPPEAAYATFIDVSRWWSGEHSWSGNAANLRLDPRAGGCWCETWPGGSAEHLRVTYAEPGKKLVLAGALGPLTELAATGSMIAEFERISGGTRLTLTYRVAGLYAGNGVGLAPAVDGVLAEQVKRYRQLAATAKGPDPLADR